MGLFSFSQYGFLNESQRPRLQRARSTDVTGNRLTALAHTETRPVPPRKVRIATTSSESRLFQ